MKNKNEAGRKLDLDAEVIADLEASDTETDAIRGGAAAVGSIRASSVTLK